MGICAIGALQCLIAEHEVDSGANDVVASREIWVDLLNLLCLTYTR